MKYSKLIIIILIFCFCNQFKTQQIFIEVGRVNSKFNYSDSKGENNLDLYPSNNFSYAVGYRTTLSEIFYLNGALIFNKYGAFGSDEIFSNSFQWDVNYLGISASIDGEIYKKRGFAGFARVAIEPQFMTSGTQQINGEVFNLKGVEQFDSPLTFLKGGVGFNWCSDPKIALSLKYMYGMGFPLSKGTDGESLKYKTGTFSIGVMWSINKCKYCYGKR